MDNSRSAAPTKLAHTNSYANLCLPVDNMGDLLSYLLTHDLQNFRNDGHACNMYWEYGMYNS
jgi:hypothetical protein